MGNTVDPASILEIIKRARLYNPTLAQGAQGAAPAQAQDPNSQVQSSAQQAQTPVQNTQQIPQQGQTQPQNQFPPPTQNPVQISASQGIPQQTQTAITSPVSSPVISPQDSQIIPLKPGNIDLSNRPVVKNPDGTSSTVSTITIEEDGHAILLPTIINGQRVSEKEAIDHYHKTGEHMGIFDTEEHADRYDQQLHNKMGWNGLPGGTQEAWQKGEIKPPQSQTQSPRDQTLAAYRQAIQSPAPNQADYKPSIGRRVVAGLLGGVAGLSNPKTGYEVAHGIANSAYDKSVSDYQKKLAQKKEAYELESGAQKEDTTEKEQIARTGAEGERAKAETARRLGEEGKLRTLQKGTPEYDAELEKLRIQHPNTPKIPAPYELELKNGEKVPLAYEGQDGQFKDAEGNVYGSDAIKNARKIGTTVPKNPTEEARKEYNDYYNGMKAKHPKMTDDEIASSYKQIAPPERNAAAPIVIGPDGKVVALRPGMTAPEGYETPGQKGSDTQGTSTTRTMTEMAPRVSTLIDKVNTSIDAQIKSLGPGKSRWSEFWAGKVGEPNPEFTKLRTDTMLLQTLLMRMHTGSRGSKEIMDHFRSLIDAGKQSPENMKAALGEIKSYIDDIKSEKGSNKSIKDNPKDPLGIL